MITFELDKPYEIDAVLVIGENDSSVHISEFNIYIGFSSDYLSNTLCDGGPFAYPLDATYGSYSENIQERGSDWINGIEAWCNLPGNHVSFVRDGSAQPVLNSIVLCTFGVLSKFPYPTFWA